MAVDFEADLDVFFDVEVFASSALYEPNSGRSLPCSVLAGQLDAVSRFGDTRVVQSTRSVEVRRSEVADPKSGDLFHMLDENGLSLERLRIVGKPTLDAEGLTWTCGTEPVG